MWLANREISAATSRTTIRMDDPAATNWRPLKPVSPITTLLVSPAVTGTSSWEMAGQPVQPFVTSLRTVIGAQWATDGTATVERLAPATSVGRVPISSISLILRVA